MMNMYVTLANTEKCKIINICNRSTYPERKYLNDIESPFTKLSLNTDNKWDSNMI